MNDTAETAGTGALMLAMTDLFISATATLLVVLTLATPDPPVPLPVQADVMMLCPGSGPGNKEFAVFPAASVDFGEKVSALYPGVTIYSVADAADLAKAIGDMNLPAKSMYSVALAPAPGRPLTAACFATAMKRLLADYHSRINDLHGISMPILGLQVITRLVREKKSGE